MRCISPLLFALLLLALPRPAVGQARPPAGPPGTPRGGPSLGLVLDLGVEYGGDRVAQAVFTDGSTQSMRGGQGGTAAVGVEIRPHRSAPVGLRATAGFKFVTTAASNADVTLTRIPLELVGTYALTRDLWLGAGYVHHTRVRFNGDGVVPDFAFRDAPGGTVELGWRWFALSYTMLAYTDEFGAKYDASSAGVSVILAFRRR